MKLWFCRLLGTREEEMNWLLSSLSCSWLRDSPSEEEDDSSLGIAGNLECSCSDGLDAPSAKGWKMEAFFNIVLSGEVQYFEMLVQILCSSLCNLWHDIMYYRPDTSVKFTQINTLFHHVCMGLLCISGWWDKPPLPWMQMQPHHCSWVAASSPGQWAKN